MFGVYYILDKNKLAIPVATVVEWARFFEIKAARRVALEEIGGLTISTVFLGIDLSFGDSEVPILFETMIFKGDSSIDCDRCGTWEEAIEMHERHVAKVIAKITAGADQ